MHLKELVILDLSWSPVTKYSKFWKKISKKVEKLKVLNLQGCRKLHESLDFPAPINLEILILRVKKLPLELAQMKFLKELLIDGTGIKVIYIRKGSLQFLNKLSACGCEKLKDISTISYLGSLTSLALDGAEKVRVPKTFEFPQKLERLSLRECRMFDKLPPSIDKLGARGNGPFIHWNHRTTRVSQGIEKFEDAEDGTHSPTKIS
ncbi:disease resistance protein RPS4-like [Eucalyptus grandis]|uniref:disease resistance protein RPS4-like n=1 Tax=Eucalyptus grandis TaxID=71139 RepID=UPI00192E7C03|nr:disease resistance protein RPS4-like [Eucalyptus grandis]